MLLNKVQCGNELKDEDGLALIQWWSLITT